MAWEHFRHEADIGVRGYGKTAQEAFVEGALALMGIIANPSDIPPKVKVEVACEAPLLDILFVDWLNAIIYEMDTKDILFSKFELSLQENTPSLKATLFGEEIKKLNIDLGVDLKGATFTELKVEKQNDNSWVAQCIIDV